MVNDAQKDGRVSWVGYESDRERAEDVGSCGRGPGDGGCGVLPDTSASLGCRGIPAADARPHADPAVLLRIYAKGIVVRGRCMSQDRGCRPPVRKDDLPIATSAPGRARTDT